MSPAYHSRFRSEPSRRHINLRATTRLTALLTVTLIGCGGAESGADGGASGSSPATAAGSSGAPAATVDACSLLTSSEIAAATGLGWGEGTVNASLSARGRSVCDWVATGGDYATAQVMTVADASIFEANRDSAREVFGLVQGDVSITGADRAYATSEGSLIAMVVGDLFVQVTYIPPGPGNVMSATRQLATAVAGRL